MAIQAAKSGGRPQAWYESVPSISNNAKKITSVRRIWRAVAKQNVPERKVGRPSVVNEDLVKRAQIYRDAEYAARGGHGRVTQGKVAEALQISRSSARKVLVEGLKQRPFKKVKETKLRLMHIQARQEWLSKVKVIVEENPQFLDDVVWTDEKLFLSSDASNHNSQNDRVWMPVGMRKSEVPDGMLSVNNSENLRVMVSLCGGVTSGYSVLIVEEGVKIDTDAYIGMLKTHLRNIRLNRTRKGVSLDFYWQEDNAPSHASKKTQDFLAKAPNVGLMPTCTAGNRSYHWPPMSPDLNPCDYTFWTKIVQTMGSTQGLTREEFEVRIMDTIGLVMSDEAYVKRCVENFKKRMDMCLALQGGRFERKLRSRGKAPASPEGEMLGEGQEDLDTGTSSESDDSDTTMHSADSNFE